MRAEALCNCKIIIIYTLAVIVYTLPVGRTLILNPSRLRLRLRCHLSQRLSTNVCRPPHAVVRLVSEDVEGLRLLRLRIGPPGDGSRLSSRLSLRLRLRFRLGR